MTPGVVFKGEAQQPSVDGENRSKNVEDDVDKHEPEYKRQSNLFRRVKTSAPNHGKR
jgi:hypothetical protein